MSSGSVVVVILHNLTSLPNNTALFEELVTMILPFFYCLKVWARPVRIYFYCSHAAQWLKCSHPRSRPLSLGLDPKTPDCVSNHPDTLHNSA